MKNSKNSAKLSTRDILTVVLMSLINIVIFGFSTFLYFSPFTIPLMPVFFSLLQGIVYYMIGVKVQKKGAMLIYCIIQGVVGFNIPYIAMFVLSGIIAELILWKTGYGNFKAIGASYVIMQVLAAFGSTIYPYVISLDATIANMKNTGSLDENIVKAGELISSWRCLILIALIIVTAIIGALIGQAIMKKHLIKAKTAEDDED